MFLQRKSANIQSAHEKMPHIISPQGRSEPRWNSTYTRWGCQSQERENDNRGRGWGEWGLILCWWECTTVCCHFGKQSVKKLNIELPYNPAILPLGIYPSKLKCMSAQKLVCGGLTIALHRTAEGWRQHACLSAEEWVTEICHLHTMKYYSAIKGMKHWYMIQHKRILKMLY